MRSVAMEELSVEKFLPFGSYAKLIDPKAERLGSSPIEFFPDILQQSLGGTTDLSFSVCRVTKKDLVIDNTEYHNYTGEGILPLDNDVLIYVAPATPPNTDVPLDKIKVFRVPKGTMVVLRPGVWHYAPFAINDSPVNVLIVLPERTYVNDCVIIEIPEADQIAIDI